MNSTRSPLGPASTLSLPASAASIGGEGVLGDELRQPTAAIITIHATQDRWLGLRIAAHPTRTSLPPVERDVPHLAAGLVPRARRAAGGLRCPRIGFPKSTRWSNDSARRDRG